MKILEVSQPLHGGCLSFKQTGTLFKKKWNSILPKHVYGFFLPKILNLYATNNDLRASRIGRFNIQLPVFQVMHHKVVLPMSTVKQEEGVAPLLYCATWQDELHLQLNSIIHIPPNSFLTTILLLQIKYRSMTPEAALDHVRSIRPRVLLAPSQWQV